MKHFLTFIILVAGFSAHSKSSLLLSSAEFKALPKEAQVKYLKKVQNVLAEMTQRSLYMASEETSSDGRLPASDEKPSFPGDLSDSKKENIISELEGPAKSSPVQDRSKNVKSTDLPIIRPVVEALAKSKEARAKDVAQAQEAAAKREKEAAETPGNPPYTLNTKSQVTPVPEASTTTPDKTGWGKVDVDKNGKKEQVEVKPELEKEKEEKPYRCMYAGWVIAKDPCRGYDKLPVPLGIPGIDPDKMACKPGYTMCNPIIFGLRIPSDCKSLKDCPEKAEAICGKKGAWPTKDCAVNSSSLDTMVAAEINSTLKPELYVLYTKQFDDLCNPEKIKTNSFADTLNGKPRTDKKPQAIRDDISQTCKIAEKKMEQVNADMVGYFKVGKAKKKSESKSQK